MAMRGDRNGQEKNRRKKWQKAFLSALRENATVSEACARVEIERSTAYDYAKKNEAFDKEWRDIVNAENDVLRRSAMKRAIHGSERVLIHKGAPVLVNGKYLKETVHETALTIFLLKKRLPDEFADDWNNGAAGGGSHVPPSELAAEVRRALAQTADIFVAKAEPAPVATVDPPADPGAS
jgi:hypothetical protein